ncbi:hypothetical protein BUALT_Bualt09G0001300 [Buddleja alternifolia]|uniref:Uncharacterized protein n=1 Tax=Buddleja alternifolia TaxID=168488 RepID=A0AAV6X031_9LAMI|nr:hypothetical protein BUALT_Bualt09G0001300 [Buddleja alternifolia]
MQSGRTMNAEKPTTGRRGSIRERKLALQQDALEFLADVAVLDEGVVRIEEKDLESRVINHEQSDERRVEISLIDDSLNKISESIMKCFMNIFLRMTLKKSRATLETLSSLSALNSSELFTYLEFKDPYCICSNTYNAGAYNTYHLSLIFRLPFQKLDSVDLMGLTHQGKLAFWINVYNSCMMNV